MTKGGAIVQNKTRIFVPVDPAREANGVSLVKQPFMLTHWPVIGTLLEVPPGYRAVVTAPGGVTKVLGEGLRTLSGVPWGRCVVRYVNVRRFVYRHPPVCALTQDGWQAIVDATLECTVRSPRAVVEMQNPIGFLQQAASSAIVHVIKSTPHDLLIGGANGSDDGHQTIDWRIRSRLQTTLRGSGMQVVNVFVGQSQGDERRLDIKRQSRVDETRISENGRILEEKMDLGRKEQKLVLQQAETARLRAEEEQKIQLEQARIEASVARLLKEVREWEVRLQLIPELTKQRHEQLLENTRAHAKILSKTAQLGTMQGLPVSSRRRPEGWGIEGIEGIMTQGLMSLQGLPAEVPMHPDTASSEALPSRLARDLLELSAVEGLTWTVNGQKEDEMLQINVQYDGLTITITFDPRCPEDRPDVVVASNGRRMQPVFSDWRPSSLRDTVMEAAQRFSESDRMGDATACTAAS